MALGESNKPFVPIEEPYGYIDYMPTKTEWAADNREQIIKTGNSGIIYSVPKGKTLYIFYIWIRSLETSGTGRAYFSFNIYDEGSSNNVSLLNFYIPANSHKCVNASFPIPVKVSGGKTIRLDSSGTQDKIGGFIGYLE